MSRFFVNKECSGISFGVFASLNGTILTVDIVTGGCDNPGDGVIKQDEKRETILALSVDLEKRIQTTWWLWCKWKAIAKSWKENGRIPNGK